MEKISVAGDVGADTFPMMHAGHGVRKSAAGVSATLFPYQVLWSPQIRSTKKPWPSYGLHEALG